MSDYKSLGLSEEDLKVIYKWMDLGRKIDERPVSYTHLRAHET